MKRRDFITMAGVGAIGAPAQGSRWQPDGAGSLARIGVLTPHFDPVPESEMWAMAPAGVSVHAARVLCCRGGARAFHEPPNVDDAAEHLSGLTPRVILYAWTTSS
jgi:maleate isomerase